MKFAEAVQKARKMRGFSQGALADKCGWTRSKQSHIETGRYGEPKAKDRARLQEVLECTFVAGADPDSWDITAAPISSRA